VTSGIDSGSLTVSSGLLAAVVDGAGVGILVLDAERRIVIANPAFCDLLGYRASELQGREERTLVDHQDVALDAQLFADLMTQATPRYTVEKRYLHKSGESVWGRIIATLLRDATGDFVIAVVEDITEKRSLEQAAEEVRRAHERYALVARATNDVIWDWDAEHGTIIWNDALQTMFGYQPEQIDNRLEWWDSHLNPDDRERVVNGINGIIEKGGSSWTDEYRFERADGSFTEVLDRGYIARSEDGKPIRMIGAMLDVTERKRAERTATFMADASAILASSLDYRETLARVAALTIPVLADWCSVDLRTDERAYERLAAFREEGGRSVAWEETSLGSGSHDAVLEVIITGKPRLIENIAAGGGGDDAEALRLLGIRSAMIVPLMVVPGNRAMGAITLATGRSRRVLGERDLRVVEDAARRAALAIEHARLFEDARKASLAKDEFLAILSHELSTPLTIILGWSGIISRPDVTEDERRRGIESIRSSALAQAQLIDDVLDLSRVTTGKLSLDVQPVSLGKLVADSLTAVRVAASAKRIDLSGPLTPIAATVMGDGNRLRQVVWNLLTNAIKFTRPGGRVAVALEQSATTVRIIVSDTGQGIAPEFLAHVFEPFRQADASSTRSHGGLGLGLAIVRYLVEGHGGTVSAFSEGPELGARFEVELPIAGATPPVPSSGVVDLLRMTEQAPTSSRAGELAGVHVLFVDDQAPARELANVIFSNAGAGILIASSAREALAILATEQVDIVVTDIGMPEVDGYGLIQEIRRRDTLRGRRTPVIALTAYRGQDDQERVHAAGFDGYLRKPMDASLLTATVATVIAAARER